MCEKILLNQMLIDVDYDLRNLETNNHLNLMSLPVVIAISMALSHSGHMRNGGLQSSMVFPDKRSFYTSRNVNSDLITG